jgi:serine/threonine protein kinase
LLSGVLIKAENAGIIDHKKRGPAHNPVFPRPYWILAESGDFLADISFLPDIALKPGEIVRGRFEILSTIGEGSFSTVYLAADLKIKGARWAVKELRENALPAKEREVALRQFEKEASLLGKLNHTGIPKIIDHFSYDHRHFMVMEHIEGETLEMKMERADLTMKSLVAWAMKICDILDYLHHLQPYHLIYRDLKPSNIMITSGGRVMLIDFGIARFFKPRRAKDTCFLGTPGFCPPEQYGASQSNVSNDIYGLGATLYHLLTGVNMEKLQYRVPPVSHYNGSVPRELQRIIARSMNMDRARRYGSAQKLKSDLERLEGKMIEPVKPPSPVLLSPRERVVPGTRRLDERPRRTTMLDAPVVVTRLLLDYPVIKTTLTPLLKGSRQFELPVWTGALLLIALLFFFVIIPCGSKFHSRYAENRKYVALIDILHAFPAYNAPRPSHTGSDTPETPLSPTGESSPLASLPQDTREPARTALPEKVTATPFIPDGMDKNGGLPVIPEVGKHFPILKNSTIPEKTLSRQSPPISVATLPPLVKPGKSGAQENSLTISGGDGKIYSFTVPSASPESRNQQVQQLNSYHIRYSPDSVRLSSPPSQPAARTTASRYASGGESYYSNGSGNSSYGFVPASSPGAGVTWGTSGFR